MIVIVTVPSAERPSVSVARNETVADPVLAPALNRTWSPTLVKVPLPGITTVFEQLVESAGSTKHLLEMGSSLVTTTLAVIAVLTAVVPDGLETVGRVGAFTFTVCCPVPVCPIWSVTFAETVALPV